MSRKKRINLPNGCSCTPLNVWPANWNTSRASTKKTWYITYRFFMPGAPRHLVHLRGMNEHTELSKRQAVTEWIIKQEIHRLTVLGFNPVLRKNKPEESVAGEITPETPLPVALERAFNELKVSETTRPDIKSAVKYLKKACDHCFFTFIPVKDTRRRHIVSLLNACEKNKDLNWSPNRFNKYRDYLRMLFKVIVRNEAIETNPLLEIDKETVIRKARQVLTPDQRAAVRERFREDEAYLLFIQLFFHSGGRLTELCNIRTQDVDLKGQRYKALIKKGKQYKEVWRPIKNIAVQYWAALVETAKPGDYLLGRGLKPGPIPCRPDYLSKKWTKVVVKGMDIPVTLYQLKHLNLTEVSEMLSEAHAAHLAGHTTTAMVRSIYNVRHQENKDNLIKSVNNEF